MRLLLYVSILYAEANVIRDVAQSVSVRRRGHRAKKKQIHKSRQLMRLGPKTAGIRRDRSTDHNGESVSMSAEQPAINVLWGVGRCSYM